LFGQTAEIDFTLTLTDSAGGFQVLHFGLDPAASDTLDPQLGESELPPSPPLGVFDARFIGSDIGIELGQGTVRDYRPGNGTLSVTTTHEVFYQVGSGAAVTLSVDLPPEVSCRFQDFITGAIIDTTLTGSAAYTVGNPGAIAKLRLSVSYSLAAPSSPVLLSPSNGDIGFDAVAPLLWSEVATASSYHLQVSEDSLFTQAVIDTVVSDTAHLCSRDVLIPSTAYWWHVAAINVTGEGAFAAAWSFTTALWNAVDEQDGVPQVFELHQNYPNPFNPSTAIEFTIPRAGVVSLKIYDVLGEEVSTLLEGRLDAGPSRAIWDASGLSSGVYFYRLTAAGRVLTRRMILCR